MSHLGKLWSGVSSATPHQLRPTEKSASTPNTYSGNYGLDAFPLHTDLAHWRQPPRYLVLRCLIGASKVYTLLLDSKPIIEKGGRPILSRALVQPRRPIQGALPLLRLFQQVERTQGIFRWDKLFLLPASRAGNSGFDLVNDAIRQSKHQALSLTDPGDTLIIDNWRMLHGRSSIPSGDEGRVIERMYLEEIY